MSATVTRTATSTAALSLTESMLSRPAPVMTASEDELVLRKIVLRISMFSAPNLARSGRWSR